MFSSSRLLYVELHSVESRLQQFSRQGHRSSGASRAVACAGSDRAAVVRLRAGGGARPPQVELQAVSLVVLSFFRDAAAGAALADTVAAHGGALGAAVCCSEAGGRPEDDWTTCDADRDQLLDRCVEWIDSRT